MRNKTKRIRKRRQFEDQYFVQKIKHACGCFALHLWLTLNRNQILSKQPSSFPGRKRIEYKFHPISWLKTSLRLHIPWWFDSPSLGFRCYSDSSDPLSASNLLGTKGSKPYSQHSSGFSKSKRSSDREHARKTPRSTRCIWFGSIGSHLHHSTTQIDRNNWAELPRASLHRSQTFRSSRSERRREEAARKCTQDSIQQ